MHRLLAILLLAGAPAAVLAQDPQEPPATPRPFVGAEAPEIGTARWMNLPAGEATPRLAELRGRVLLLEFWATVRKACGKGAPHAQRLHDRHARHGLHVLALSYDPFEILSSEVAAYGLTVRLGSDPSMSDFSRYSIPSVPFACVIGRDGEVLYWGVPELAEPVVLRALGLEADPGEILEELALERDPPAWRARLEWLVDSAPRAFDLAAFARERVDAAATPAADAGAGLRAWLAARERGEDGRAELAALAAGGPAPFDLKRWARALLAELAPLTAAELDGLLADRNFEAALDALLFRNPSRELLERAAASGALREHCQAATREARALARKALLAEHWYLAGLEPRSRNAYWSDLGLGGPPDTRDPDAAPTLVIGFERLDRASAASYFEDAILRHLLAQRLASGQRPDPVAIAARAPKERESLLQAALARHGDPVQR